MGPGVLRMQALCQFTSQHTEHFTTLLYPESGGWREG